MAMRSREFMARVSEAALAALGDEKPQSRVGVAMIQLYFDSPRQHYEVWLQRRTGRIEVGLHFEGARDENLLRLAVIADQMPLIVSRLGPGVEVEEWTESWTRVHETLPLKVLDEAFAAELGRRVAGFVETLEPIIRLFGPLLAAPVSRSAARTRFGQRRPRSRNSL